MASTSNNSNGLGNSDFSGYLPIITSAATAIFCFMPWLRIPLANMANMFVGGTDLLQTDYTVLSAFNFLSAALEADTSDSSGTIKFMVYGFMALWAAGIALLAFGAIQYYLSEKKEYLLAGGALSAVAGALWMIGVNYLNGYVAQEVSLSVFELTPWPIATIVGGAATAILAANAQAPAAVHVPQPARGPVQTPRGPVQTQQRVQTQQQVQTPQQPQTMVKASCTCPTCGYTVQVEVPNQNCMVNIICGHCGAKFPMEVRPRG